MIYNVCSVSLGVIYLLTFAKNTPSLLYMPLIIPVPLVVAILWRTNALLFYSDKETENSYEGRNNDTVRHGLMDIFKTPSSTDTVGASPIIL